MGGFSVKRRPILMALTSVIVILLSPAVDAGQMVLASCWDKTGSGMGQRIHKLLKKELLSKGADLKSYRSYLKYAQKKDLDRKALRPSSIKFLAPSLNLDAVATCKVTKTGHRFSVRFRLYGPSGKKMLSRAYSSKKPWLRLGTVEKLAQKMTDVLRSFTQALDEESDEIALVPLVPLLPETKRIPEQKDQASLSEKTNPFKAKKIPMKTSSAKTSALTDLIPKPGLAPKHLSEPGPEVTAKPEKETTSKSVKIVLEKPISKKARRPQLHLPSGPVPALLLELGASSHSRAGLSPRYEASYYPGIRLAAHVFMGTFINTPVLKDIGISGKFSTAFGLRYSSDNTSSKLAGKEQLWSAELMYRLELEKILQRELLTAPTLLIRFGYGDIINSIDKKFPDILSARYTYTFGALDLNFWIIRPLLSISLSAGFLFDVWPSDSLAGEGSGFCMSAGFSMSLLKGLRVWTGYEQVQFFLNEKSMGDTSDRYQMFSMRLGWFYD